MRTVEKQIEKNDVKQVRQFTLLCFICLLLYFVTLLI